MTWYKRYRIPFQSRLGAQYMVYVYEQTNGNVVTLKGANNPFSTREDDSEDIFTPLRGQTGYLRIIDETGGTMLANMMPSNSTEKLVRLYEGTWNSSFTSFTDGDMKWQGFMQAQAFTQPWDGQKNILEFPLRSILATLYDMQIQTTTFFTEHNIAYLIKNAIESLGITPSNVTIFCDLDSPMLSFMLSILQYRIFCNEDDVINEGETTTVVSGITYGRALEYVLSLFGLSAREHENNIYITQYDIVSGTIKKYTYTWAEIATLAGGNTVSKTAGSLNSHNMLEYLNFRSIENSASYITGVKTAIVSVDIDNTNPSLSLPQTAENTSEVYEVDVEEDRTVFAQAHANRTGGTETYTYLKYEKYTYISTSNYAEMLSHCVLTGYTMNPYYSPSSTPAITGAFPVRWFYKKDDSDVVKLVSGLFLNTHYYQRSSSPTPNLCYSIASNYSFDMKDGYLNIQFALHNFILDRDNGGTYFSDINAYWGVDIVSEMQVAVRIGSKFWNKSSNSWIVSNDPIANKFTISLNNNTINSNKNNDMNVDESNGYFIPVRDMDGIVEFYILNCTYTNKKGDSLSPLISFYRIINDLKLTYLQNLSITASERTSNVYRQTIIANSFSGEKEIYLDLGTMNNNAQSATFLKKYSGTWLENVLYSDNTESRPEIRLLSRIAAQFAISRRKYRAVVDSDLDIMESTYTYLNRRFFGVDVNHNWRDDEQEVEFIEVS